VGVRNYQQSNCSMSNRCLTDIKERLSALVRDLFTFSSEVIKCS
jgi:hypothetical protein